MTAPSLRPANMRRTISSAFLEVVFPALVVVAVPCGLVMLWLGKPNGSGRPLTLGELGFFTLIGVFLVVRQVASIKQVRRVQADGSALYVSNYLREIRIPLSEVARVREGEAYKRLNWTIIDLRHQSAFGKRIEFYPRLCLYWSGLHPVVSELRALCKQVSGQNGVDPDSPFDPAEKIFEAGDDCVLQIGKDFILYGLEGKEEVSEKDRFLWKDLARIAVVRSKKSKRITVIDFWVKGQREAFEIDSYTPNEMEEIARLLETRAGSLSIQFQEKQSDQSKHVFLLIVGLGGLVATICSAGFLYYGWTMREMLWDIGGILYAVICLLVLGVTAATWVAFWRCLRD